MKATNTHQNTFQFFNFGRCPDLLKEGRMPTRYPTSTTQSQFAKMRGSTATFGNPIEIMANEDEAARESTAAGARNDGLSMSMSVPLYAPCGKSPQGDFWQPVLIMSALGRKRTLGWSVRLGWKADIAGPRRQSYLCGVWKTALLVLLSAIVGAGAGVVSMAVLLSPSVPVTIDTLRSLSGVGMAIALFFTLPGALLLLGVRLAARAMHATAPTEAVAILVTGTLAGATILGVGDFLAGGDGWAGVRWGADFGFWTSIAFVVLSQLIFDREATSA